MATVTEVLGLGLVALGLRLGDAFRPPIFDELYHVLAARSWVIDGTFRIADGVYERATAFTVLIGTAFEFFGDSLIVARLPSIVAGMVMVLVLFLWLRTVAGRGAAWIAALALCLSPEAIFASVHIRFYTLHALLILCGAIGAHALATRRHGLLATALLVAATLSALGLALHLQITTYIGLLALALWLGFRAAGVLLSARTQVVKLVWVAAALAATLAIGVAAVLTTEYGAGTLKIYRSAPLWNIEAGNKLEYYVVSLALRYPTFFSLFPLAALYAIGKRPAVASLCVTIFAVSFLVLSLGASKAERYIFFAMPFFFAVWGIALAEGAAPLFNSLRGLTDAAAQKLGLVRDIPKRLHWCITGLVLAFIMFTNTAFPLGLKMAFNPRPVSAKWQTVEPILRPIAQAADVVLTTEDINALYFIDRHDMFISATKLSEQRPGEEFTIDRRTGRPIISTAKSLKRVMACYATGLVIAEELHWLNDIYVTEVVAFLITSQMERIDLAEKAGIRAYRWRAPLSDANVDCQGLPAFGRKTAR